MDPLGSAGLVSGPGLLIWWRAACALVVALAVQIGTNYANDYSDGVRGTDARRVGPTRLVASGIASPKAVRAAAFTSFGVGAAVGAVLALSTSPWALFSQPPVYPRVGTAMALRCSISEPSDWDRRLAPPG